MGSAKKGRRGPDGAATGPTVTLCRGCCCGTERKHPGVDHAGQVARLRDDTAGAGRVRVSDCLDACAQSTVVVVSPSPAGRAAGARPVWLLGVLDGDTEDEIAAWVRAGGPGVAEPPGLLDLRIFTPARRIRQQLS
jgi:(2Fe-2S) ferredoxin